MDNDLKRQLYLERYSADRTHELELDKLSGELERTFLQTAGVLNGASATVFISFLGSTLDKVKTSAGLTAATLIVWLLGLCLSILAGVNAYKAQQQFMMESRVRRHEGGLRLFEEEYRNASGVYPQHDASHFAQRAEAANAKGEASWGLASRLAVASIILFGVGAFLALATVLSASPVKPG